jgi:hypothetical protein
MSGTLEIIEEGVTKLLNNLNPHKVPGPDNIIPRVLKELCFERRYGVTI